MESIKVPILKEGKWCTKMNNGKDFQITTKIGDWPVQAKVYASTVLLMIAIGLFFAMVQVAIHDVIPTFQVLSSHSSTDAHESSGAPDEIGDLLSGSDIKESQVPFYKDRDFLFALKFTHIHIFGMGLLFMIIGFFVIFFDINPKIRNALIILPFIGILVDLLAVWLKVLISPYFFFLHIPGGTLFVVVFAIDFVIAYRQMWR
jgi:hypothetical protein